jgi:hypothetical protein
MNIHIDEFEIDPNITKMIYEHCFCGKPKEEPLVKAWVRFRGIAFEMERWS